MSLSPQQIRLICVNRTAKNVTLQKKKKKKKKKKERENKKEKLSLSNYIRLLSSYYLRPRKRSHRFLFIMLIAFSLYSRFSFFPLLKSIKGIIHSTGTKYVYNLFSSKSCRPKMLHSLFLRKKLFFEWEHECQACNYNLKNRLSRRDRQYILLVALWGILVV